MQMMNLYFHGPLHSLPDGYKYSLTCKDAFTRFHCLIPTKGTWRSIIMEAWEKGLFVYWGLTDKIVGDNATEFTSARMKKICNKQNYTLRTTLPYNPSSNSVERMHSTMPEIFRAFGKTTRGKWRELVPAMTLAINSSVIRVTDGKIILFSDNFLPKYKTSPGQWIAATKEKIKPKTPPSKDLKWLDQDYIQQNSFDIIIFDVIKGIYSFEQVIGFNQMITFNGRQNTALGKLTEQIHHSVFTISEEALSQKTFLSH